MPYTMSWVIKDENRHFGLFFRDIGGQRCMRMCESVSNAVNFVNSQQMGITKKASEQCQAGLPCFGSFTSIVLECQNLMERTPLSKLVVPCHCGSKQEP